MPAVENPMLWASWQKYKNVSAESLSESIEKKYKVLSEAVCTQIEADAARFSRLGDSDEVIYAHLVGLMGVYRRVVLLSNGQEHECPTVDALISGVCEVLNSRLREFEEETDGMVNPITLEKQALVYLKLKDTAELIEKHKHNFLEGLRHDGPEVWDESFDVILHGAFRELHSFYREGLRGCVAGIDDLHNRKTANFYMELIEREWEELGNIIKVQVHALEEARENNPHDNTALPSILDALREAYQQTGPVIENLQKLLNAPKKKKMPCRPFEEFESGLTAALEKAAAQPAEQKEFFEALDAEALNLLDAIDMDYKKAVYKFQLFISAEVLLAEEITKAFEKSLNEIPETFGDALDTERDILSGIRETIDIKISGLKESTADFIKQSGDMLKEFANRKEYEDEEIQTLLTAVRSAWLESPPNNESEFAAFFAGCQSGEIFAPFREQTDKQIGAFLEKPEKLSFVFKKEVLLYEICTFEEILTHSVSRLRGSENIEILDAAHMLDDTFRELEIILKKNNIAIIRPVVKEQFNAKEHEVLVAEKHDDYEKGEIIKVMTAGYRFKE